MVGFEKALGAVKVIKDQIQYMITLKMADQGRSDFCVVFAMSRCALELKQTVISLLFQIILP